ncbi:MAG: leucine-rich repeat domain-containing protein [Clostridia bacterium]|nr:leucine-rich repeat domain-containing protein [Clostridia bacterium]
MKNKYKGRLKILIAFGILFLIVSVLLMLIFLESKKSYTVEFDPNGGTVLSGSLVQNVMQGQDAVPPSVVMDGAVLRGWSASFRRVTRDLVIEAVWEYETTAGIIYTESENQNFTEIQGSYPNLRGEVYLDAYFDEKKVLGILDHAFANQTGITKVYLLDGLLSIGNSAFSNCTSLTEIEIPKTVTSVGANAFQRCASLETLVLEDGILAIGESAFSGCKALTEVILPESVTTIGSQAFAGCTNLVIKTTIPKEEWPTGWADGWFGDATVEVVEIEEEVDENVKDKDKDRRR